MSTVINKVVAAVACALICSSPSLIAQTAPAPECREISESIRSIMKAHVFDPSVISSPAYQTIDREIVELSLQCRDLASFVEEFNTRWKNGPYSHVRLDRARMSAEQTAHYLDTMSVPRPGAVLTWNNEIAVLTVYTMMGRNTITQITDAYTAVQAKNAKALIIDLRKNEGGAFAVRPLVGHLLTSNLETGLFLSRPWFNDHSGVPDSNVIHSLPAWDGWSIRTFWNDVQSNGILRIVFTPMAPQYTGQVFVLTSKRTASAAELAVDALKMTGRVTVIGERTAGKMLSQKMYDIPHGLQLSLPVADYFARHSGRIEGRGVTPSVIVPSDSAMTKALELIWKDSVK